MSAAGPDPETLFRPLIGRRGVLLAVSGGRDSTALMVLAAEWAKGAGRAVPLHVATVDHGLRPEAADEAALVCANAGRLGLPCMILKAKVPETGQAGPGEDKDADTERGNIQARAREARYRCLAEAARQQHCDCIVTAHHREDQAETFLIRLARGSGVYGLGGMAEEADVDGLSLVRPLLGLDRAELHAIAARSGLECVDDPSNENLAFARVRWRAMLPELEAAGLSPVRIADTAGRLRRAAEALDHYAGDLLKRHIAVDDLGGAAGGAGFLADAPDETALRALARLLQAVGGSEYTPRLDRIEQLLAAVRSEFAGSGGFRRTLNDCVVDLDAGQLRVFREWGRDGPPRTKAGPGETLVWDRRFSVEIPADLASGVRVAAIDDHVKFCPEDGISAELRTIPGLFDEDRLIALPRMLGAAAGRNGLPVFACHCLVAERLLNPRSNRLITRPENL